MSILSGNITEDSRVIVIRESDWVIEKNVLMPAGNYEINYLTTGNKIIVARSEETGECQSYGAVVSVGEAIPDGPYVHYIGDNIVSSTNWPDSGINGMHLTSGAGTKSVQTDGPNGHKYLRIGSGAIITSGGIAVPPAATVAVVVRVPGTGSINAYGLWAVGDRYSGETYAFSVRHNLGGGYVVLKGQGQNLTTNSSASPWLAGSWFLCTFRYNNSTWYQTNKTGHLRRNGVDMSTSTVVASNSGSGSKKIMLGMDYDFPGADYAEFIYYQRVINDEELSMMENHFKAKYSLY